jgi:hypothetical protein
MPPFATALVYLVTSIADGDTLTARCETPTGTENLQVPLGACVLDPTMRPFN